MKNLSRTDTQSTGTGRDTPDASPLTCWWTGLLVFNLFYSWKSSQPHKWGFMTLLGFPTPRLMNIALEEKALVSWNSVEMSFVVETQISLIYESWYSSEHLIKFWIDSRRARWWLIIPCLLFFLGCGTSRIHFNKNKGSRTIPSEIEVSFFE